MYVVIIISPFVVSSVPTASASLIQCCWFVLTQLTRITITHLSSNYSLSNDHDAERNCSSRLSLLRWKASFIIYPTSLDTRMTRCIGKYRWTMCVQRPGLGRWLLTRVNTPPPWTITTLKTKADWPRRLKLFLSMVHGLQCGTTNMRTYM